MQKKYAGTATIMMTKKISPIVKQESNAALGQIIQYHDCITMNAIFVFIHSLD